MMRVTHREIATLLQEAGSQVVASESHGCLAGALCTSADYSVDRWLDELVTLSDESPSIEAMPLRLLFDDTQRALRGHEMEFEPLLPDDELPLEERALALAQWCQGFLYGFATGKRMQPNELKGQIEEILRDLTHIAGATVEVGEATEDDEASYAELVEYLRVGVQLIHDELAAMRDASDLAQEDAASRTDDVDMHADDDDAGDRLH